MCTLRTIYDTIAYRKKMDTAIRVSGGQESRLYFMKENNCKMTELPAGELPYEKCINKGAEVLSDAELLAIILRTGTKGMHWNFPEKYWMQEHQEMDFLACII